MAKKKAGGGHRAVVGSPPARIPQPSTPVTDALDALLHERYHGAVNIRGIRFQVRYAVLRALELARMLRSGPPGTLGRDGGSVSSGASVAVCCIQFEGIEDVDVRAGAGPDLRPFWVNSEPAEDGLGAGQEFIQVKTSDQPWSWYMLGEPLAGFLKIVRAATVPFGLRLLVNFALQGDVAALAQYATLGKGVQRDLRGKFLALCRKHGGTDSEADKILGRLAIEAIREDDLRERTRTALTDAFDLADSTVLETYELAFVGKALDWSSTRRAVSGADVLDVGRRLGEGLAVQQHYVAWARRWVGPLELRGDGSPDDFFEGKKVRLGHIVLDLDVRRPKWAERIAQALERVGVCVIRGPSGHGKSTIAFRFAVEGWPPSQTVVVRSAETTEQVEAIADYLRFRAELGLPVRVLIDSDYKTRRWPEVAGAAVAVGAQVLVTVRMEDWFRFDLGALTRREIIEPTLSREEAEDIFRQFQARKRIHHEVRSAAWAFEKLQAPHLLLEYVYLLTHGEMLEERLRDQVRQFDRLGEDPRKADLLRLVVLGDTLGAPVLLDRLLAVSPLRDDPQRVLGSLVGEYLEIHDKLVTGLHWVRSEHIARILHEGGIPPVTQSMLRVAELVPLDALRVLVANGCRWPGIDRPAFIRGLVERYRTADTGVLLAILEGLFEAGERQFYEVNKPVFDAAHRAEGPPGMLFFAFEVLPFLRTGALDSMISILGPEKSGGFRAFKELAQQLTDNPRGMDRAREFLAAVAPHRSLDRLPSDGQTGRLLDWCALSGVRLPCSEEALSKLVSDAGPLALPPAEFAWFLQGLHRYDPATHVAWFEAQRGEFLACAQLHLEALSLELSSPSSVETRELAASDLDACPVEVSDRETEKIKPEDVLRARQDAQDHGIPSADVNIVFPVVQAGHATPHEQKVWRLNLARQLFPFVGRYKTRGDWLLPESLKLPHDETICHVPRWNSPYESDVAKNVVWSRVVTADYLPDTFYRLQEAWWEARQSALRLVEGLSSAFVCILRGKTGAAQRALAEVMDLVNDVERRLRFLPAFDEQRLVQRAQPLSDRLRRAMRDRSPNHWRSSLSNTIQQFFEYCRTQDAGKGRLCVYNAGEARDYVPDMQAFFDVFFLDSPDYFDARALNERERQATADFVILLKARITEPVEPPIGRPIAELRERAERQDARSLERIVDALGSLPGGGTSIILPRALVRDHGTRRVVLGVTVNDPEQPHEELFAAAEVLKEAADEADEFYFVAVHDGARLTKGAYRASSHLLRRSAEDIDQTAILSMAVPTDLPATLEPFAPNLPIKDPTPSLSTLVRPLHAWTRAYLRRRVAIQAVGVGGGRDHVAYKELRKKLRAQLADVERDLVAMTAAVRRLLSETHTIRGVPASEGDALEIPAQMITAFADQVDAAVQAPDTDDVGIPWTAEELMGAVDHFSLAPGPTRRN